MSKTNLIIAMIFIILTALLKYSGLFHYILAKLLQIESEVLEYLLSGSVIGFIKLCLRGVLEKYFEVYPLTLSYNLISNIRITIRGLKNYLLNKLLPEVSIITILEAYKLEKVQLPDLKTFIKAYKMEKLENPNFKTFKDALNWTLYQYKPLYMGVDGSQSGSGAQSGSGTQSSSGTQSGSSTQSGGGAQYGSNTKLGSGGQYGVLVRPNEYEFPDGTFVIIGDGANCRLISGKLHLPKGNPLGGPPIGFIPPGFWLEADGTLKSVNKDGNPVKHVSETVSGFNTNDMIVRIPENQIGKQLRNAPGAQYLIQAGNPVGGPPVGYRPPGVWRDAVTGNLSGYINVGGTLKPLNIQGIANMIGPINFGGTVSSPLTGSGAQSGGSTQLDKKQ